jgi:hypothetical protein
MSPDGRHVIVVRRTDSLPWRITRGLAGYSRRLALNLANVVEASANSPSDDACAVDLLSLSGRWLRLRLLASESTGVRTAGNMLDASLRSR